jgi:nucleotide-binding universal stress UspA family protein
MSSPKIAVGIDFSPESEVAANEAAALARNVGGELLLVHAASPDMGPPPYTVTGASARALESVRKLFEQSHAETRAQLGILREKLSRPDLSVKQAFIEGFPDSGLCTAAHELGADLTVVGTHGRTGIKWFFLGSVAQRVIRMSEGDVLVARGGGSAEGGYKRIVVATDFSPSSERALDRAIWLAAPDAEIDVVHFYQPLPRAGVYDAARSAIGFDLHEGLITDMTNAGQSFIGQRRASGRTIRFLAAPEAPVPGVVHWLERQRFDLVALGSHGRRGFRRFIIGSVAEAVARRAPCSVLIAHAAA